MLPGLKKAKELAKNISCRNNMKQIYYGAIQYSNDYNGYLSPGGFDNFYVFLSEYTGAPRFQTSAKGAFICPSVYQYQDADTGEISSSLQDIQRFEGSYSPTRFQASRSSVKIQGGWISEDSSGRMAFPRKLGNILGSAVLMTEKTMINYKYSWMSQCATAFPRSDTNIINNLSHSAFIAGGASFRHSGKTNFLFTEGNIDSFKMRANLVYDEVWRNKAWKIRNE
jgi:hypothetical protein